MMWSCQASTSAIPQKSSVGSSSSANDCIAAEKRYTLATIREEEFHTLQRMVPLLGGQQGFILLTEDADLYTRHQSDRVRLQNNAEWSTGSDNYYQLKSRVTANHTAMEYIQFGKSP
ncbi:hypothetical protein N7528_007320 [Penicillium herquei]|nr:hypothetical protein N7528_007320 [Penicillium herquei]